MTRSKDQLSDEVVRILRALRTLPHDRERERHAILARDLAETMVELRCHYLTPEGNPDWTGRTWAYRDAVRTLYAAADYSPQDRVKTQTSVRYHVGNLIRQHLSPEDLDAAGLTAPAPQERQAARRARNSALLATLTAEIDPDAPLADKISGLRDILAALNGERFNRRHLTAPDNAADAQTIARLLASIRDRSAGLLGELRTLGISEG